MVLKVAADGLFFFFFFFFSFSVLCRRGGGRLCCLCCWLGGDEVEGSGGVGLCLGGDGGTALVVKLLPSRCFDFGVLVRFV